MSTENLEIVGPTENVEIGEIDLPEILLSEMAELGRSRAMSDVTFDIQNQMIPGHLSVLAARSEYFRAMLFGEFAESKQKLIKLEVPIEAFKALLTYIYSGHLSLSQKHIENTLDTLCLAQEYGLTQLEKSISEYLHQSLSLDNVCAILDTARMHSLETLQNLCHTFLDTNAKTILDHESFKYLSEEALKDIISRDSFYAPEIKIFTAVSEWCKHNPNAATESVFSLVRLPLMSLDELFKEVQPSRVFDSVTLLEAIKQQTMKTTLVYRAALNKSTESVYLVRRTEEETNDEIAHPEILLSEISALCMSEELSDVTFEIQNEIIPGHLSVLTARSQYFRAFFFGGLAESKQKPIKLEVPIVAFKALLRYIYSGHLSLSKMHIDHILDILCLAYQYEFTQLKLSISEYLRQSLSVHNVCMILDTARNYGWKTFRNACHRFLDLNAKEILDHESFKYLSEEALKDIISRDSFYAPEVQIFIAVMEWRKLNPNAAFESVLSLIRLPLMSLEDLFTKVQHFGVFDSDTLLEAIKQKITSTSLPYRGESWLDENVINEKFNARVIEGESGSSLLLERNGIVLKSIYVSKISGFGHIKNYAHHMITANHGLGIVVELGTITVVNYIKILPLKCDSRCYSYFVDVSVDKTQWERVVDHQSYRCQSWQFLHFPSRAVRYIKLVGTHITNSANTMFEVVSFEAYFKENVPKIINGFVSPTKNVATTEMGALVGNSCNAPQFLLNGYDIISGFTYHKIGNGSIVVQLAQPYLIGSMRLLLLDCDDNRNYSYYIETSTNEEDWEVVVDKRNEDCRSWQHLIFEPRVIVFIKIIGTKSVVNDEFHCLYFECPSQTTKTTDD